MAKLTTNIDDIYLGALEREATEERHAYLEEACAGNSELRRRVERLLEASQKVGGFLEAPAPEIFPLGSQPEPPGTVIGPYKLRELLGDGGMGSVYVAEQQEPVRRKVALKIIKPGMDSRPVLARFEAERQTLSLMDHPHIAKVLDAGTTESGRPYFVMELVRGVPITEFCDQRRLDPRQRLELFIQVCRAIQHAHQKGIIHRDIKPSNILVTMHDDLAVPKVIDFGIAKATSQGLSEQTVYTAFNQLIGTPLYMSPEQAEMNALDVDTRSDVYSLGVLLYELLTGSTPFDGDTLRQAGFDEMRRLIREVDPPRPSQRISFLSRSGEPSRTDQNSLPLAGRVGERVKAGASETAKLASTIAERRGIDQRHLHRALRGDLDWIVMKALEKDRNRRYESASALAADVQSYLNDEPVQARPTSLVYRCRKLVRRRPAIVVLWVVSVLAVATIAGINARRIEDVGQAVEQSNKMSTLAAQESQRADDENATARRLLYASRMRKAQQAWRDGNLSLLREILQHYARGTPEANLRHFEWYHLNYLANLPHRVLRGHTGEVYGVAYAPDNRVIVTGGQDGTARLWDVASGDMLAVLREHTSCINSIDFSPNGDTFVTSSCDKTIKLWSLSQRKVLATLTGHTQEIESCVFIDEGSKLASLSYEISGPREARIWDVATRSMRSDWPPAGEDIQGLAAGRSGQTLVTFANDRAAVWKRSGDSWAFSHRFEIARPCSEAVVSSDDEYLLIPGWPRSLRMCRLRDGELVNELSDHSASASGIAFSPAGDHFATASFDGAVRVFKFPLVKLEHHFLGHVGRVWQIAWSPAGDSIASVGSDGTLRVWDLQQGSSRRHLRFPADRLDTLGVGDFAFLQDGQHVNAADVGRSFIWNVKTGQSVSPEEVPGPRLRDSGTPVPDARFSEASYNLLPQWDWQASSMPPWIHRPVNDTRWGTSSCARIVADGSQIVEISGGRLRTWNMNPLELREEQSIDQFDPPQIVFDISPDGTRLFGVHTDGRLEIRDLQRWTAVDLGKCPYAEVGGACFSSTGDRILILCNVVHEYDAYSGTHIRDYPQERTTAMSYSADAQRIAVASQLGFVAIHDAVTGEETLRLDAGRGNAAVFARDGISLLTNEAPDRGLFFWPGMKETAPQ